jgi:hypothetical protein
MEQIWKLGFLGLLVLAGSGLVLAGVSQSGAVAKSAAVDASVDYCPGGCGKEAGSCGPDCTCGCQDGKCDGGCGNAAGSCGPDCACGCQNGSCGGGCGKTQDAGQKSCGGGCGCGCGG